jgi:hypothetical protein
MMLTLGLPRAGQERASGAVYALPRVPAAVALRRALLEGYAAAWLGLVPEQAPPAAGAGAAHGAAAAAVLQPVGSRLPAPPVRSARACRAGVVPGQGRWRRQLRQRVLAHRPAQPGRGPRSRARAGPPGPAGAT